jgi:predicted O-methyltransferase YrrM
MSLRNRLAKLSRIPNRSRRLYKEFTLGPLVSRIDVERFTTTSVSDISEHLNFLYFLVQIHRPHHLLELGTRGGESTRIFEMYCREQGIRGRSIDLSPAPAWLESSDNWKHYVGDDIEVGRSIGKTKEWSDGDAFEALDFVFLDTSHEYDHSVAEIKTFAPLLSETGMIVFHDTNLTSDPTRRLDGGINYGWNNDRGVVRAIEEFLNIKISEDTLQARKAENGEWFLFHMPWNNGLTVLSRLSNL